MARAREDERKKMSQTDDRYTGRPMLRFLDAYVLDALGLLDDETTNSMAALAPQLAAALGSTASQWQRIVAESLDIPDDAPDHIVHVWNDTQAKAAAQNAGVDPVTFARLVADSLLAGGEE
jgi:hypothetical protein